jgi:hypothetical protein
MVILPPNRRTLLAGLGALACLPRAALAEDIIDLNWRDLVPDGETASNRNQMACARTGTG